MAWSLPSLTDVYGGVLRAMGYRFEGAPAEMPKLGASAAPGAPTMEPIVSLAAYAEFPWVRACIDAIGEDLSGLPLRLTRGKGPNAVVIESHPVLDLFATPTTTLDRVAWERQLITYWIPTGNAAILLVGGSRPSSLALLHPELVRIVSDEVGQIAGVEYHSQAQGVRYYGPEAVQVLASPSWRANHESMVGEGAISALKYDLNAERNAVKLASRQAARGRPDVVLSPTEAGALIPKAARDEIASAYADFAGRNGAALVLSGAMKAEWPQYTLRDLEFADQRKLTRETVLAVLAVPPTRLGLPMANYATANQQERSYWQGLRARAALLDASYTRIARRFDPSLTLTHDFSQVPALQESRTERLERVHGWVSLGATPAEAAAYEGFADAPVDAEPEAEPVPEKEPAKAVSLALLFPSPEGAAVKRALPATEDERATVWRGWVASVHRPQETKVAAATVRALRKQSKRIVARLESMPVGLSVTRDLVSDIMGYLFPADESAMWSRDMKAAILEAVRAGYADGATQLGRDWTLDMRSADVVADRQLATMVAQTLPSTQDDIRREVLEGIDEGETVNEIGQRIQRATSFKPARGLLIARTETTRSLNNGHDAAYGRMAEEEGVTVRRQWLSARDSATRDPHIILDGQERAVGELFVIEAGEFAGEKGTGPGGFDKAALVCNCRCTTVPVVEVA